MVVLLVTHQMILEVVDHKDMLAEIEIILMPVVAEALVVLALMLVLVLEEMVVLVYNFLQYSKIQDKHQL